MTENVICYLFPIDIHVCHFQENLKETAQILGVTTRICFEEHMP